MTQDIVKNNEKIRAQVESDNQRTVKRKASSSFIVLENKRTD